MTNIESCFPDCQSRLQGDPLIEVIETFAPNTFRHEIWQLPERFDFCTGLSQKLREPGDNLQFGNPRQYLYSILFPSSSNLRNL